MEENEKKEAVASHEIFPYCKHTLLVPPKCLGLRLLPFSLGHVDILTAIESPVVTEAIGQSSAEDTAAAIWICSKTYEAAIQQYRSGRALRALKKLGRRWGSRPKAFANERAVFFDYLNAYFMTPPRWDPDKPVRPVVPWHLSIFAALQRDLKYRPDELWNMPLPRALELFAAAAANRGDNSLIPMDEQALIKKIMEVDQ
jgi:hypothetical protein